MGLDCSHDAFSGAYSAFNSLRQAVAWAIGGSYPPHYERNSEGNLIMESSGGLIKQYEKMDDTKWYCPDDFAAEEHPGIFEFLCHSDCDGEISPEMCTKVADELQPLVEKLTGLDSYGHIARDGGFAAVLQKFIDGCREAAKNDEPLRFM